ncbi:hypothetical protein [Frigoribacterium sp. UYMn621]|uniref:hypothetical protein n=1 Tax=Frigoribacterium sp. UYMn621 TaxID=3156343 RepID=UPI003399535E
MTMSKGDSASGRPRSGIAFVLPLVALWVIPVLLFVTLVPFSQSMESTALAARAPVTVAVGSRLDASRQAVDVTAVTSASSQVKSATSGLVTAVKVAPNSPMVNGTPLIDVSGTTIRAYIEPSPLFRDLSVGAKGDDVSQLGSFLASLGLLPAASVSSTYGRSLAAAASAYAKSIGVTPNGVFSAANVAWVPADSTSVGVVKVRVGDTVGAGDVLIESAGVPTSVKFVVSGGGSQKPTVPTGTLRLTSGSAHVDIESLSLTPAESSSVLGLLVAATTSGSVSATSQGSQTIYSGAVLSVASPARVGVVPSGSIYLTGSDVACVFVAESKTYRSIRLSAPDLIRGELGSVAVPTTLIGSRLVRDPSALPPTVRATCK